MFAVVVFGFLSGTIASIEAHTGRWKVDGSNCYWDANDDGPDQCDPNDPPGRYKDDGNGGCYWEPNDWGPDQCAPSQPPSPTGRYKIDANGGCYWAADESGADQCQPGQIVDQDGDGIDDALEQQLAEEFLPLIHYSISETCDVPAPQRVVFRARHPSVSGVPQNDYILINYSHLYDSDCGPNGHEGDSEPFEVFLHWDGTDWQFGAIAATAHWGAGSAFCEKQTSSGVDELWIGNDKHGTYAQLSACSGCFGSDHCNAPFYTQSHVLYNAGEPDHLLLTDLGTIYGPWSGKGLWSQFYGAGVIFDKLFNSNFVQNYPTPQEGACSTSCYEDYVQCNYDHYDSQCEVRYNSCLSVCHGWHWDQ